MPRRPSTGRPDLDARITELLDAVGPSDDRELLTDILTTATRLAGDAVDTLDLKITASALREMRDAFLTFAPYRDIPKVTVFGSARTKPDDPLYALTRSLAAALAAEGWMVVTGAGPGIMAAAAEGAGPEHSLGVSIRLPFEQVSSPLLAGDARLVSMKYFFTRKLMLVKESQAFVCLPGGFGTLDETFELLTLTQTGKGVPVPIVFLDTPEIDYWEQATAFIAEDLVRLGLIAPEDLRLFTLAQRAEDAVSEITRFYRNYRSLRWIGDVLVLRMRRAPGPDLLAELNREFADLLTRGEIRVGGPHAVEIADDDALELERVTLRFNKRRPSRLRALIDRLNAIDVADAPAPAGPPMPAAEEAAT